MFTHSLALKKHGSMYEKRQKFCEDRGV